MHRSAQIDSLPEAFEYINEMNPQGRWGEETAQATREAVAKVLQDQMNSTVDRRLTELARRGRADRRNGSYRRQLLTGLGNIELQVPRTRTFSARNVIRAYARRTKDVDQSILAGFVLGLSTRKISKALLPMLGEPVSASTVSRVAKALDQAVKAFHERPLFNRYRALVFDGVVLSRKTGAGAIRRPVLVTLGILSDGRKEVLDYRLARSESQAEWEKFLNDLYRRGLTGERAEILIVDGGGGLLAGVDTVYPNLPLQRCWAHKVRNVTDKVRRADADAVKRSLRAIYEAKDVRAARKAARRFADQWEDEYPRAVNCLRRDLGDLLTFFNFRSKEWRRRTRTTNAIERRFREVQRRTRPMGVFSDRTSIDRILYAVFTHENHNQKIPTLFLVTHNS